MASTRRTAVQAAGLLLTGAVAGGVLAVTLGASASSPPASTTGPTSYAATGPARGGGPDGRLHGFGAMQAGTVTAVGAKSVTIKGPGAAKSYAVDANSDIDKNGEAKLSDLSAGDTVRFALRPGTSTIAVLHAGDEALNRPTRGAGGPGGPCPGHHGDRDGGPSSGTQPSPVPTSAA